MEDTIEPLYKEQPDETMDWKHWTRTLMNSANKKKEFYPDRTEILTRTQTFVKNSL